MNGVYDWLDRLSVGAMLAICLGLFVLALVLEWRRTARVRAARRACRRVDLRTGSVAPRMPDLRPSDAGMEPAEKARRCGIDELEVEDWTLWSGRVK